MNWYFEALKNYLKFKGRSGRKEYWWFNLINVFLYFSLLFIDKKVGWVSDQSRNEGLLSSLFVLAIFIPSISLNIRRLHDIGKSGFWLFINFLPLLGALTLLYFSIQKSQPETNLYGPVSNRS